MNEQDYCEKRNLFCFICGEFTPSRCIRKRNAKLTYVFCKYYEDQGRVWGDENYVPQICCSACSQSFQKWKNQSINQIPKYKPRFKEPMTWMNPGNHDPEECYFCVNFVSGTNSPKKGAMQYVETINTVVPVKHNKQSPPLLVLHEDVAHAIDPYLQGAGNEEAMDIDLESEINQPSTSTEYFPSQSVNTNPILVTQTYLNHMVKKLELSQRKSATLASLLRNNNLLDQGVTIVSQKKREAQFIQFFQTENNLTFCPDIPALMEKLQIEYEVEDWRLFIDASKSGLKSILMHIDNAYMPIPVAYSRILKETYESIRLIFQKVKYDEHKWDVSGDFKVVALVMGLQLGRTKNSCFICTWISTAKIDHYNATWEKRSCYEIGIMNVKEKSLVPPEKISFRRLKINMTPKIHYLHQHLDFFKDDLGKISDEHGERFHQQIKVFEERFQGKPIENMLAEYVWNGFQDEEEQRLLTEGVMPRTRSAMSMRSDRLSFL